MPIFELSIKSSYVSDWGTWECVREIIQNGIDEDRRGKKLTVEHKDGWLTVYNHGSHMEPKALLMGETDKANNAALAGEHGEGLDVGILAGVRNGLEIKITTQTHRWDPYISFSKIYGSEVLMVRTRKLRKKTDGTTVSIKINQETWMRFSNRFIPFANVDPSKTLKLENGGMVILDSQYKGDIFVKGIFVQHIKDMKLGYNLTNVKLDRDRRLIDGWDLKFRLAEMYRLAIASNPQLISPILYQSLRDGDPDTNGFEYDYSLEVSDAVAKEFIKEQGVNAIPVTSIGESSDLKHLNKQGVVVNKILKQVLATSAKIQDANEVKEEYKNSVGHRYSWHDLTEEEQSNLQIAAQILDSAIPLISPDEHKPILDRTNVVDFMKSDILGSQYELGKLLIARKLLSNKAETLLTLTHEEAHRLSDSGDGTIDHVNILQELWSTMFWNKQEG